MASPRPPLQDTSPDAVTVDESNAPEPEQPAFAPAPSLDGGASQRRVEQVSPAHSSASPSVDGPTLGGDKLGGELAGSESTGDTTAYSSAPHGSGSSASRHSRSEGIVLQYGSPLAAGARWADLKVNFLIWDTLCNLAASAADTNPVSNGLCEYKRASYTAMCSHQSWMSR